MKHIFLLLFVFNLSLSNSINAQGYIAAIGGGSENYNDWSDAPYAWIVQNAANKKVVILSYSDEDNWLPNYFLAKGALSAINIKINNRIIADSQAVFDSIVTANAVFIKGGDQYLYITLWKGTKTELAIKQVYQNGGVVAGTSAGAMVLGQFDFTAKFGSVTSASALNNPMSSAHDLDSAFLPLVPGVLFDTHFIERGRFGRMLAFLGKLVNLGHPALAIGVDDRTALCISPDGTAEVMGSGAVTFYDGAVHSGMNIYDDGYVFNKVKAHQLVKGWKFNLNDRVVSYIPPSARAFVPKVYSSENLNHYFNGTSSVSSQLSGTFPAFSNSSGKYRIFTHPGFLPYISPLTDYLLQNNKIFDTVLVVISKLNDSSYASRLTESTANIFTGDSLSLLARLTDTSTLAGRTFDLYSKIGPGNHYFFGNTAKLLGDYFVDGTETEEYAAYRGKLFVSAGFGYIHNVIFQPMVFEESAFYENRSASVLYGMMKTGNATGVYLNTDYKMYHEVFMNGMMAFQPYKFLAVSALGCNFVDSSTYRASGSIGPRQAVAFDNFTVSAGIYQWGYYYYGSGMIGPMVGIDENDHVIPSDFGIINYPNPFNPSTNLRFRLSESSDVKLMIYNITGELVSSLAEGYREAGIHTVSFNAGKLSGGVYLAVLRVNNQIFTTKMLLLK